MLSNILFGLVKLELTSCLSVSLPLAIAINLVVSTDKHERQGLYGSKEFQGHKILKNGSTIYIK